MGDRTSNDHGSTSHQIASTITTGPTPAFGHDKRRDILGSLDDREDGPSAD
ncbi:hypothetical protein EDB89DRAFT_2097812, partial [Lactarius sanguifluus]